LKRNKTGELQDHLSTGEANMMRAPQHQRSNLKRLGHGRRGIALLFVISLIVVFFLFATTFVAMSSSYMRSSDLKLRGERTTQLKVRNVVDDVFYMLVRDTASNHPLFGQSILADQYGIETFGIKQDPELGLFMDSSGSFGGFCDGVNGITAEASYASGQVFDIKMSTSQLLGIDHARRLALLSATREDFLGRWFTFLDGPMSGVTMPIIEYKFLLNNSAAPTDVECHFYVLAQAESEQWSQNLSVLGSMGGARFVINGRPFDGIDGKNEAGIVVKAPESNEPYDVVSDDIEYPFRSNRNLFLSTDALGSTTLPLERRQVPSFHRYAQFAAQSIDPAAVTYNHLRSVAALALRPSPVENPNFTGSNPNGRFYDPAFGYASQNRFPTPRPILALPNFYAENGFSPQSQDHWRHLLHGLLGNDPMELSDLRLPASPGLDVDTDGDGRVDAMWMDLGLAPILLPNGRRVKPLVAVKIEDMDGRLNLNTHGSLADLRNNGTPSGIGIPYGQGYGPADVKLGSMIANGRLNWALTLKYGTNTSNVLSFPDAPGYTNPLHAARWFGFLDNILPNISGGLYGTASDYQGQFVVGSVGQSVDPTLPANPDPGMVLPFFQKAPAAGLLTQIVDSPYEFDLFRDGSPHRFYNYTTSPPTLATLAANAAEEDHPFSVVDLETLLRGYDSDYIKRREDAKSQRTTAPKRTLLERFLGSFDPTVSTANDNLRRQMTTHSFEVPALPGNLASVLRRTLASRNIVNGNVLGDASYNENSRFQTAGAFLTPAGALNYEAAVEQQVLMMLGSDIVAGLPFNLHRKFGNGINDDPANDTINDEYGDPVVGGMVESTSGQSATTVDAIAGTVIDLDFDNDGFLPSTSGDNDQYLARAAFARQLYTLVLMISDPDMSASTASLTPAAVRRRVALAQWVINVVDFQDADSISTPFEFDINPFNGWHVDGALRTRPEVGNPGFLENGIEGDVTDVMDSSTGRERYVVWGAERPDVLLTEGMAFHDHRSRIQSGTNADQTHMPTSSAFVELYNPNLVPSVDQQEQGDTYSSLSATVKGVDLRKVTPAGEPAYRMLVVRDEDRGLNPDYLISDFDALFRDQEVNGGNRRFAQTGVNDIERTVYFVNPNVLLNNIDTYVTANSIDMATSPLRVQLAKGSVQHFPSNVNNFVLLPGQHAVVGSAGPHDQFASTLNTTIFGRIPLAVADDTYDPTVDSFERPAVRLNPGLPIQVGLYDRNDASKMVLVPNTIGIPLDRADPTNPNVYRNFSLSEPIVGYNLNDSAGDPAVPEEDGFLYQAAYANCFYDGVDMDIRRYGAISDPSDANNPTHRHVVLQRLANPEQPFHPEYNPYLTLDDLGVGLNAYGGMGEDSNITQRLPMRTANQRGRFGAASQMAYDTAAVGSTIVAGVAQKNVWLRTVNGNWDMEPIPGTDDGTFPLTLTQYDGTNFNYLNPAQFSFGEVNQPYADPTVATQAVPWLRFANRPLISQFELASVPFQSTGLMLEHVIWTDPTRYDHYGDDAFLSNSNIVNLTAFPPVGTTAAPLPGYLLNFFGETAGVRSLARIFEFTTVPSPFVGTEIYLSPFAKSNGGFGADTTGPGGSFGDGPKFNAPFNYVSKRRIPGKINVNTVNWEQTWTALMGGTGSAYLMNTQFTDFNTATRNFMTPLPIRSTPFRQNEVATIPPYRLPAYDRENSLWRPMTTMSAPMFDYQNAAPAYNTDKNEYFRNQKRQRMANTTTQRSSVFAIWVTVGYFELEEIAVPVPDNPDAFYGDVSYSGNVVWKSCIGQEYGIDNGKVKRDRAFYIFDRSIPVGFVPGENLNVDKAVLLKRYLD